MLILIMWSPLVMALDTNGTVSSLFFRTSISPPVYPIPPNLKPNEPLFRMGLQSLPEGALVTGALLLGGEQLGLTANESTNLNALLTTTYSQIDTDPAFAKVASALPFCFASQRQTNGHYFLYRPNALPKAPECIVFLHGYGGNFQFYTWVLKEAFPQAVILAPSWGVSWNRGSPAYLKDMLADAEGRLGIPLKRPWLMAISAGGRGGFLLYNQQPDLFQGYVCLASVPEYPTALRKDLRVLMINGTRDPMVPIEIARRQAGLAKRNVTSLSYKEIESDHFFILSRRAETFKEIRNFMTNR